VSAAAARAFFAALNARDDDAIRALMRPGCPTALPGVPPGAEGYVTLIRQMSTAFPDLHHEIADLVDAGDRVTVVTRTTGTQRQSFMGHPAQGRRFSAAGIDVLDFEDGRITARFGVFDTVTMLHQLGLYR
jgi:steroid delta-isomerase-like uncharacterized protein